MDRPTTIKDYKDKVIVDTPEEVERWWIENKEKLEWYMETLRNFLRTTQSFRKDKYDANALYMPSTLQLEFIHVQYVEVFGEEMEKKLCVLGSTVNSLIIFTAAGGPEHWSNISYIANWFAEHYPEVSPWE